MPLKRLTTFLLFALSMVGHSQIPDLSPLSKISVMTCGPGEELYATFGHSAFRVKDPAIGLDIIYNYGVFDFYSDNFYVNFAKGKLDYKLARQRYSNFIREYKYDNRWVNEQVLQLSQSEKNELFRFLENNALPENSTYPYDFFYNNCATKIWDVLDTVFPEKLVFDEDYLEKQYTHRELIRLNMPLNSWSAFGIDLALGAVIDDIATPKEHMFLPIYIMKEINKAKLGTKPLLRTLKTVYKPQPQEPKSNFLGSPLFWALGLLLLVIIFTFSDHRNNRRTKGVDLALFLITGIAGMVIFFLWFITDHTATANNFNILWAFPFNLITAFFIGRKQSLPWWTNKYLLMVLALLMAVVPLWVLEVQIFSPVLIPILLALGIRYSFLYVHNHKQKTQSIA